MNIYQNNLIADMGSHYSGSTPSNFKSPTEPCCIFGLQDSVFYQLAITVIVVLLLVVVAITIINKIKKK